MYAIFDQRSPPPCPAPFNLAADILGRAKKLGSKIAFAVISPRGTERWSDERLEARNAWLEAAYITEHDSITSENSENRSKARARYQRYLHLDHAIL